MIVNLQCFVHLCFVLHYSLQSVALFMIVLTLEKNKTQKWYFEVDDYSRFIFLLLIGSNFSVQLDRNIIRKLMSHQQEDDKDQVVRCQIYAFRNPVILSSLNPRMQIMTEQLMLIAFAIILNILCQILLSNHDNFGSHF